MTFRMVFDTRSQEAVEICLEMFSAEQNVALHKSRFFEKKFSNSSNTLVMEPSKEVYCHLIFSLVMFGHYFMPYHRADLDVTLVG